MPKRNKEVVNNRNQTRDQGNTGFSDLSSPLEPIVINLIDDFYGSIFGWNDSKITESSDFDETKAYWRKSYSSRTVHLANQYDMSMKEWNLDNHLQVIIHHNLLLRMS